MGWHGSSVAGFAPLFAPVGAFTADAFRGIAERASAPGEVWAAENVHPAMPFVASSIEPFEVSAAAMMLRKASGNESGYELTDASRRLTAERAIPRRDDAAQGIGGTKERPPAADPYRSGAATTASTATARNSKVR
ncbi:MAG TPA: hypothetical protein VGK63_00150 [Candidatus Limnocylindrales bacterium]